MCDIGVPYTCAFARGHSPLYSPVFPWCFSAGLGHWFPPPGVPPSVRKFRIDVHNKDCYLIEFVCVRYGDSGGPDVVVLVCVCVVLVVVLVCVVVLMCVVVLVCGVSGSAGEWCMYVWWCWCL